MKYILITLILCIGQLNLKSDPISTDLGTPQAPTLDSQQASVYLSVTIAARNYTVELGKYGLGITYGDIHDYKASEEPNYFISSPYTKIFLCFTYFKLPFSPLILLIFMSLLILCSIITYRHLKSSS